MSSCLFDGLSSTLIVIITFFPIDNCLNILTILPLIAGFLLVWAMLSSVQRWVGVGGIFWVNISSWYQRNILSNLFSQYFAFLKQETARLNVSVCVLIFTIHSGNIFILSDAGLHSWDFLKGHEGYIQVGIDFLICPILLGRLHETSTWKLSRQGTGLNILSLMC